mmetsp:Transcript_23992/g.78206  ORF Transcript_23992/g.78206 Transcript_23992/m.78206 type:complete len:201 (+) Transcript_23992:752-1354(+)
MSLRSPNTSASPWECGAQRSPGCTSYSSQSRADEPGAPPARSIGQLSTPSPSRYGASPGGMEAVHGLPDAIATRVGSQSVAWNFSYETAPRGMPGPRTAPTTRVPPSQSVFLPPRRGKFELHVPSLPLVGPPLSLEKRTSESSHMPRRLSAAVTCPTPSSSALAIAHTSCRRVSPPVRPRYRSTYCGGASSGQCTAWYGR